MRKLIVIMFAAASFAAASAHAQVGVSIGINQPGVYGQINIGGGYPPPALVYPQPVLVAPVPGVMAPPPPMYMYVPPRYQRNWRHYCGRYNACGRPVYFVQEQWVRDRYQHEHPGWDRGRGNPHRWHSDHDRDHGRHGSDHGSDHGRDHR